jgi:hypothetical protein
MIRRTLACLALTFELAGCRAPAPLPAVSPAAQRVAETPAPDAWTGEASARAERAGAGPAIVVRVDAAAPGDRVGGVVEAPQDACLLVIARGAATVDDLDLFLYGEDGALLAADESTDKEATVLACPPHPRHVYVTARVAAGQGVVAVVAHVVPAERAETVAGTLGVRRSGPGSGPEPWLSLDRTLADHRRYLGGAWQTQRRLVLPMDPRVPTRLSANVEAGACMHALAVPSDEVSHLELTAVDDGGRIIGRAPTEGLERTLVVCSPVGAAITLELRPHAGRGVVALLLSRADDEAGARIGGPFRHDVVPTASVDDGRRRLAEQLEGRGYREPREIARGELQVGTRTSLPVDLADGCTRLDLVLGKPGLDVEVWLWDAEGNLIAHDLGVGRATLFACGSRGRARLDVEAASHPGPYLVEARSLMRPGKPLTEAPLAAGRLLRKLDAVGLLAVPGDAASVRRVRVVSETLHRESVVIPVGRCATVVVGSGRGATGPEVRLVESRTQAEIGRARGTHSASVRACALDLPGTLELVAEIRVAAGAADALVVIRQTAP